VGRVLDPRQRRHDIKIHRGVVRRIAANDKQGLDLPRLHPRRQRPQGITPAGLPSLGRQQFVGDGVAGIFQDAVARLGESVRLGRLVGPHHDESVVGMGHQITSNSVRHTPMLRVIQELTHRRGADRLGQVVPEEQLGGDTTQHGGNVAGRGGF